MSVTRSLQEEAAALGPRVHWVGGIQEERKKEIDTPIAMVI